MGVVSRQQDLCILPGKTYASCLQDMHVCARKHNISMCPGQRLRRLGFQRLGFQKSSSMRFDAVRWKKIIDIDSHRIASNRIESHRDRCDPMRFDAIRCESISMNFFIELHRIASMNFFENPVFENPVFRALMASDRWAQEAHQSNATDKKMAGGRPFEETDGSWPEMILHRC